MTRRSLSVKTATKATRIALLAMIAMVAVSFAFTAADAKVDYAQTDFEKDAIKKYNPDGIEATWNALDQVQGPLSNAQMGAVWNNQPKDMVANQMRPKNVVPRAQAHTQAQANQSGNNAGDIAREQAIQSIDYCSRFMKNFTTEGGNRWNRYRDGFFIPMAILLILPGAVLTQVRAIIAQGNPILAGQATPLEGIQRAIVGVFLVPSTYLVVNYSIDLGNSLHYTIASEYKRLQGTDMYEDAMCAEIRAFGVRYLKENAGAQDTPPQDTAARGNDPFAKLEGKLWGKLADPCTGLLLVPANRDDASMSQGAIGTRLAMNMTNAGINTAWSILTAFQMAFMYYLFFVGPIMAALWTWPMKMFKDAFPAWVEGVITLSFWSFFWNVVILILALTKSEDSTGLYMVSACNFLMTAAVKYAFDFAGLMRGAAAEAEKMGAKAAKGAQGGGKGGKGGSKGGSKGRKGSSNTGDTATPAAAPAPAPAPAPADEPTKVAARASLLPKPVVTADAKLNPAPSTLVSRTLPAMKPVTVEMASLPPSAMTEEERLAGLGIDPDRITPYGSHSIRTFNPVTGVWNDPIKAPPLAGAQPTAQARNTIASVLGNAIQAIFHYPRSAKYVDPDSVIRPKKEEKQADFVETIECDTELNEVELTPAEIETSQAFAQSAQEQTPIQHPTEESETEEAEMKNDPPRTNKEQDERFSFMPPPLASADKGKTFDATMSVSDIPLAGEEETCSSLLSKMSDVVSENDYAAPLVPNANLFRPLKSNTAAPVEKDPQLNQLHQFQQAQFIQQIQQDHLNQQQAALAQPAQEPVQQEQAALTFAQELAQVYSAHMPRVFAEQEAQRQTSPNYTGPINSFIAPQQALEEEVITVVDYTSMPAPVAQPVTVAQPVQAAKPTQTNSGLNSILKSRGLAKAPVNADVSNSWFA